MRSLSLGGSDPLPPPPRADAADELATVAASHPPPVGFEVLGELGRGGMGVVYKARQRSLNRIVALKTLLAGAHADPEQAMRFRREAEAIARLHHPHIVQVHDILEHDGRLCIVLEFVEGGSLSRKLGGKPLPVVEAVRLMATIAQAVHAAHGSGVFHRDLKPANILLMADGSPKITDFGLAKLATFSAAAGDGPVAPTASGVVMGTPHYMAPEQAEGRTHEIGPATDVYSLGVILYELLAGRPPFRGGNAFHTIHQVLTEEPAPPSRYSPNLPPELDAICLKCLRKQPGQRYASALDLSEALVAFLTRASQTATAPSRPAAPSRPRRRQACLAIAGVGLMLVLGFGLWLQTAPRTSWDVLPSPAPGEKFDRIAFRDRQVGYAVSRQSVYKTSDGGRSWTKLPGDAPGRVHVLHFEDEQTGWLGTDHLLHTRDGGITWTPVSLGSEDLVAVTALAIGPDGEALAGATRREDHSFRLFRRKDSRSLWQELDPEQCRYWGGPSMPYRLWQVGGIAIHQKGTASLALFRGAENGGVLLNTVDASATWEAGLIADAALYRIHFVDARRGWLTGSGGSLWATRDGGKRWEPQSNPALATASALAFDPLGRLGIAPLGEGKVLVTSGASWQVESIPLVGSLPSAAVVDSSCAYVLGADGRIARRLATGR